MRRRSLQSSISIRLVLSSVVVIALGCGGEADKKSENSTGKKAKEPVASGDTKKSSKSSASPPAKSPPQAGNETGDSQKTSSVAGTSEVKAAAALEEKLKAFQIPPAWFAEVETEWDAASKPWKEGRIEIRRLLGVNDEQSRRQGIKLTWEYLQKKDIGDGHEYGMYMFLGNEPLWAIVAYREYVGRNDLAYPPYFGLKALASLYADYGIYQEGEKLLRQALAMSPPKREWQVMRQAEMQDALGDHYVAWGKTADAKQAYEKAIELYPQAKPPYGRHLLPRRAKKVQAKLDLISQASLQSAKLADGTYRDTALGYSGDIKLSVVVRDGKINKIDVRHQEKIDQNACKLIPERIVDKQSLSVDGISGATVTKNAIVAGTLRALRQAGLK